MNIKIMIKELLASGLTQTDIGKHVGIGQSGVSFILSGRVKSMKYDKGLKLKELHNKRFIGH